MPPAYTWLKWTSFTWDQTESSGFNVNNLVTESLSSVYRLTLNEEAPRVPLYQILLSSVLGDTRQRLPLCRVFAGLALGKEITSEPLC